MPTRTTHPSAPSFRDKLNQFHDSAQKLIYNIYAGSSETDLISADFFNNRLNHLTPLGRHVDGFFGLGNALLFLLLTYCLGEERAEYARCLEKGFRDVNRVKNGVVSGVHSLCGPNLNTFTAIGVGLGIGACYSGLLMSLHYENSALKKATQKNWELVDELQNLRQQLEKGTQPEETLLVTASETLSCSKQQITRENPTQNRRQLFTASLIGAISGPYLAFSLYQIIAFVTTLAQVGLNPVPFLVAGLFLGAFFAWKKLQDQRQIHRHKTLSVLACEIEQTKIEIKLAGNAEIKDPNAIAKQALGRLTTLQTKFDEIKTEFDQYEKNTVITAGNAAENTVSGLKNNTIGLLGTVSVINLLAEKTPLITMSMSCCLFFCKLIVGTAFIAAAGGPVGIALLATVVLAMTSYSLWRSHKKKKEPTAFPYFPPNASSASHSSTSSQSSKAPVPSPFRHNTIFSTPHRGSISSCDTTLSCNSSDLFGHVTQNCS